MYKIKQQPSDFKVVELSNIKIGETGKYTYFLLKKKDYNTLFAIEMIANKLRIPLKRFGFAGNKDKKAITTQMCSVERVSESKLKSIDLKDISLEFKGKGDEPICLGDLKGNKFEIIARNINSAPKLQKKFINYFGEQRFGRNNALIGKSIIKKDFKKAVELILEGKGAVESKAKAFLEKNPNNYVGALKTIPKKILSLYIHAYQSLLWNKQAKKNSEEIIPIIGFDTKIDSEIIKQEKITNRDFIIKQIPQLSSEGGERKRIVEAKELFISELEEDEINSGKKKVLIKFILPKGSYATEYIKNLFQ
ncbi:tRNA pseudouridine(13) synthase TruD [Candidatus Woesearchaeota archaeon]|nr:tRNA pseudouridine(13) synthase TruD [Candidatus Woesearchaeota archaeon]